jgi:hypothetical protein
MGLGAPFDYDSLSSAALVLRSMCSTVVQTPEERVARKPRLAAFFAFWQPTSARAAASRFHATYSRVDPGVMLGPP